MDRAKEADPFCSLAGAGAAVASMAWLQGVVEGSFEIPVHELNDRVVDAFAAAMETICAVAQELEGDGALEAPVARRTADRRPMTAEELRAHVRAVLDDGDGGPSVEAFDEVELHRDVVKLAAERHAEVRPKMSSRGDGGARDPIARNVRRQSREIVAGVDWHALTSVAVPFGSPAGRSPTRPRRGSAARAVKEIADALLDDLQAGAFASKRALYDEAYRRIERRYGPRPYSRQAVQRHVRGIAEQRLGHDWARFLTGRRKRA